MSLPGGGTASLAQLLNDRARAIGGGSPRERIDQLIVLDAARWHAWPHDLPAARDLETAQLAAPPPTGDGAAERLLRASLAVRAALREPNEFDSVAATIDALPPGYPNKSLWLHWRDLLLRGGDPHRWNAVRRRLTQQVQQQGVPPSECLPVLLQQLDLTRWRAEGRLLELARDRLQARIEELQSQILSDSPRLVFQAAGGRYLLALGAETAGAEAIHATTEAAALVTTPRAARLFSRPAPEAAIWLSRAIERAELIDDDARDGILHHAIGALLALVLRHRMEHVLREALSPLPVRFSRPDVTAGILLYGARAWLACGDQWESHEWFLGGIRLAHRYPRNPLILEAAWNAARWVEATRDAGAFETLRELAQRMVGAPQLVLQAEIAGLQGLVRDKERGWEQLTLAYRQANGLHPETQPQVVLSIAATLLAWGYDHLAWALLQRVVEPYAEGTFRLPGNLLRAGGEAAEERDKLIASLRERTAKPDHLAAMVRLLARQGETAMARLAHEAAERSIDALDDPTRRLHAALNLARRVSEGIDIDLRARLELAVADEASDILERLRIDDPPYTKPVA